VARQTDSLAKEHGSLKCKEIAEFSVARQTDSLAKEHGSRKCKGIAESGKGSYKNESYQCGYCGKVKSSSSVGNDGRVRIRCECGGKYGDNKCRMHAKWNLCDTRVSACSPVSASYDNKLDTVSVDTVSSGQPTSLTGDMAGAGKAPVSPKQHALAASPPY